MSPFYLIICLGAAVILGIAGVVIFFKQSKFGRLPQGARLEKIKKSPNYLGGEFKNQLATGMFTPETSRFDAYIRFLFGKKERPKPARPLPFQKTDLLNLDPREDVLVWLGHSSYFMQLGDLGFLVDPVLSPTASPFSFVTCAFEGTNPYTVADFPEIDCLLITHDHWDHLNKPTLMGLKDRIRRIACPLGVGEHLEYWGFPADILLEGDWFDHFRLQSGVELHILPSRHFSGRSLWGQNRSLWGSFAVITPEFKVYFGGDGGYGPHFLEIGEKYGGFDLAVLENGQYNEAWPYVHMQPEECWQAALDLGAGALFPGHSAKFVISNHPWDERLERISRIASAVGESADSKGANLVKRDGGFSRRRAPGSYGRRQRRCPEAQTGIESKASLTDKESLAEANNLAPIAPALVTPMIGEKVKLQEISRAFPAWWTSVS